MKFVVLILCMLAAACGPTWGADDPAAGPQPFASKDPSEYAIALWNAYASTGDALYYHASERCKDVVRSSTIHVLPDDEYDGMSDFVAPYATPAESVSFCLPASNFSGCAYHLVLPPGASEGLSADVMVRASSDTHALEVHELMHVLQACETGATNHQPDGLWHPLTTTVSATQYP